MTSRDAASDRLSSRRDAEREQRDAA